MRYFVNVFLDTFFTRDSGDIGGKGEFYFKVNGKRYPDKGVIHLGKNETYNPEPKPTFYTALVDGSEKQLKFDFEVWEEDIGRDDKFIDKEFKFPLTMTNQVMEFTDKKNRCALKVVLSIRDAGKW